MFVWITTLISNSLLKKPSMVGNPKCDIQNINRYVDLYLPWGNTKPVRRLIHALRDGAI